MRQICILSILIACSLCDVVKGFTLGGNDNIRKTFMEELIDNPFRRDGEDPGLDFSPLILHS